MSALLVMAAQDVRRWLNELSLQGHDLTTGTTGAKLKEEAGEYFDNPCLEEAADTFIALIGTVSTQGWTLDQLATAVTEKMVINRKRKWVLVDGAHRHVEGT